MNERDLTCTRLHMIGRTIRRRRRTKGMVALLHVTVNELG
jgi:hypothetical protein